MTLAIPETTLVVTLTALGLGIATNLLTIRFVDLGKERRMKAEISQHNKDLREAVRSKDKAKEERLKKKDIQIKQMNAKVSTARLRVTAITFIPFIVLYYLMAGFLGGFGVTVAHSPIPIPYIVSNFGASGGDVPLFWWYTISSLTFSPLLTRLFGTST
ncbi:MAG: EMC3/TMCO1 family protein [Nitrososphaerales archaeon]|nr:EMC3/TMCO1 family protein [Nitrososphaerales archaeon]